MITIRGLEKSFGTQKVLDGVSLDVDEGAIHFVIGRSGSGKSVLMKHVVGLLRPDSGSVAVNGRDVGGLDDDALVELRKDVAYVFQSPALFDSMTVLDNVAVPLKYHRRLSNRKAATAAMGFLETHRLTHLARQLPQDIAAGERKQVSIVRALTLEPRVLILDEPTTYLDPAQARRMDTTIKTLNEEEGRTIVVVSHDIASVLGLAHSITMIYNGKVRWEGRPDQLESASDQAVERFVRAGKIHG